MKKTNRFLIVIGCVFAVLTLASCSRSSSGSASSGGASDTGERTFNLTLAHNMAEDHAVHIQLTSFANAVNAASNGTISIRIIPNGTLGSEADTISQIQNGALDMAKVSAGTLGNFNDQWNALSVPYVFNNQQHYFNVMDGDIAQDLYNSTADDGFVGFMWLDSGARSFYTKNTPIHTPADLRGLKIRTMDSQMAIDMMNALGGSSVVMGYSDIYAGMQQGVIDGAENNVTALRDHADVTGYYSFDEHTRIPDIVVISSSTWNAMSDNQRQVMTDCARQASNEYKTAWANFENQVISSVGDKVEFVRDVDIPAFQAACQSIYSDLQANDPEVYAIVERIRNFE